MMEFHMGERQDPAGSHRQTVVEVRNGEQVVATIYPTDDGVRIVAPGLTAIHPSYDGPPAVTLILR